MYTRQEITENGKMKESETHKEEEQDNNEESLLLFKKTKSKGRFGSDSPKEEEAITSVMVSKSTQCICVYKDIYK